MKANFSTLASVFIISILSSTTIAQDPPKLSTAQQIGTTTAPTTSKTPNSTPQTTQAPITSTVKFTLSASVSSDTNTVAPPAISTTSAPAAPIQSSDPDVPPPLPSTALTNYPVPTVPPTANSPFMQKSNLPEGTVFIAVGSALGFFALLAIAWRAVVAWSLRRSVQRIRLEDSKSSTILGRMTTTHHNNNSNKNFYNASSTGLAGSALSLEHLGASTRANNSNNNNNNNAAASSSLFFSPTAPAHTNAMIGNNRNSTYLPAGFYQAGPNVSNSSAGGVRNSGRPNTPGGGSPFISPPGSPMIRPMNSSQQLRQSRSSLALVPKAGERTPSTYLEDLFDQPPVTPQPMDEGTRHGGSGSGGYRGSQGGSGGNNRQSGYGSYRQ